MARIRSDYGNQRPDWALPEEYKEVTASKALYNKDFDFNKYDQNYNPWGNTSEGRAMMETFEAQLKANDSVAATDYGKLQQKEMGYSYTKVGTGPKDLYGGSTGGKIYTVGQGSIGGYSGMDMFDRGWKSGDTIVKRSIGRGEYAYDKVDIGKTGGYWDRSMNEQANAAARARGDRKITVAGEQLNEIESYKKWRYDVASAQMKGANIGSGENELNVGLSYMGNEMDKVLPGMGYGEQTGAQVAEEVGRTERAAGKASYKRRDIFNKRREVQSNLGRQSNKPKQGQQTGVQLGG